MFRVGVCGLERSIEKLEQKIASFMGKRANEYAIKSFTNIDELIEHGEQFNLYFLNQNLYNSSEDKLIEYIQAPKGAYNFITYIKEPISDENCDEILDCIRHYIDYDSMYLCVEFLTDMGFKTIAVSNILFFEFCDRKVRIKTQQSEYYCKDSLKNIISLVGNYDFAVPHKSFIVNMRHIKHIKGYDIEMDDGSIILLSQKKSRAFRAGYKAYLSDKNAKLTAVRKKAVKKQSPIPI